MGIESDGRITRGMAIFNSKTIKENGSGAFIVPSQTNTNTSYEVKVSDSKWTCSCPDFTTKIIDACKHIYAVKFWIATNTYFKDKRNVPASIPCDKCGSANIIKFGFDCGKQTFYCKDCQHKFREPSLLIKAKFAPELISLTLDLYFSGLSLRKTTRNISDHFDIDINFSTIYDWICRYIPIISQYVNSLTPELSETWHADELFVKIHGGQNYNGKTNLAFLWNVMDRKTRFLLASKVSEARDINGAVAVFKEAIKNAHEKLPEQILTDSWKSYKQGISKSFVDKPQHVAKCGIAKPNNNNRMERLNGTIRERTKVVRAWKKHLTPLAEGQRIHYNFVKPHEALEGQTPALMAGIKIEGKNKWKSLIQESNRKIVG
jgi:putative transposase